MEQVLSIVAAILVLCVFVIVHELGHFMMGRALKFKILEFAVGMGPVILKKNRNGIQYSLRAFPIGGMCRFYGEDEDTKDGKSFSAYAPWKRLLVLIAGPAMNIIFALIFAVIALTAYGDYVPRIHSLSEETHTAQEAGIQAGDIIYSINGDRVDYYNDAFIKIGTANPNNMLITVERGEERVDVTIPNAYDEALGRNLLGVTIEPVRKQFGLFEAVSGSFSFVGSMVNEMFDFIGSIFTKGVQQGEVMGPVGTITVIGQAVSSGFENVLRIAVLISVNLAIINILPLPALDGGRVVFVLLEWIRGKPVPPEKEGMVHFIGIVLLMGLIVFLTFSDISTMISGG